ncbi:MAG: tetratricopeptide repeat protein [Planctomycetes bacterium]|nr:tetratricopeptide repeat protein [Planctomycetota bacterium]NUQ35638.1 tetratricopeptide repeat protein [Planctomycetaceae bacterium]
MAGQPLSEREELINWLLASLAFTNRTVNPNRTRVLAHLVPKDTDAGRFAAQCSTVALAPLAMYETLRSEAQTLLHDARTTLYDRLELLHFVAMSYNWQREYRLALDTIERALPEFDHEEFPIPHASLLMVLSVALRETGDAAGFLDHTMSAIDIYRRNDFPNGVGTGLISLAIAASARGDFERAKADCLEALAIFREVGVRTNEAFALGNMGLYCLSTGDDEQGEAYLNQAIGIGRDIGAPRVFLAYAIHLAEAWILAIRRKVADIRSARCDQADRAKLHESLALLAELEPKIPRRDDFTWNDLLLLRAVCEHLLGLCEDARTHAAQALELESTIASDKGLRILRVDELLADARIIAGQE